jgi:PPOX class probable F420-dependent enzyme
LTIESAFIYRDQRPTKRGIEMDSSLAKRFSGRRYINLESYQSSGTPKLTPVQSIEHDGLLYLRTDPRSGKEGRVRGNPRVRIVPCTRSGKPTGDWVSGEARIIEGDEYERAMRLFTEKYGGLGNSLVNLVARLRRQRLTTIISIRPISEQTVPKV